MTAIAEMRASAIHAYAIHVRGLGYPAREVPLLVIGYAQGWDAAVDTLTGALLNVVERAKP